MRKQILESAALEVATQVRAVEDVIESALEEMAWLQMRMIRARAAAGVSTGTGHDALEHLAGALRAWFRRAAGLPNATPRWSTCSSSSPACAPSASATRPNARPKPARADLRVVG